MKMSKEEELLALASALYLLELEVFSSKSKLEDIIAKANAAEAPVPITQELLDNIDTYRQASLKFAELEQKYWKLKQEIEH